MIQRYAVRLLLLGFSAFLLLPRTGFSRPTPAELTPLNDGGTTNVFHPLTPGPVDGQIAAVTARMLERYHYLRPQFDDTVSSKFLDRYLETLDPQHLHFLQSDLAEFAAYRTNLDNMTAPERGAGDTSPGCVIFNRFVERLQQRVAYADELLHSEKFTFDGDDKILLNRKDSPYPKDMNDAKQLWRDRLRFEYLQELLGKIDAQKKAKAEASAGGTNAVAAASDTSAKPEAKPKKTEAEEIVDTLSRRYHRNLHAFLDWDSDDVLQIYLTALTHVFDPHSDYFGRSQLDSFAITMNLSLFGIGAELMSEDGYCTIHRILPNGPAEKSKKIKVNDRIIAVGQSNQPPVDVVDMSLNKAVQLIRGPKGTEVHLTIIPAGADSSARKELTLVRDEIKLEDQEAKGKIIELPNARGGATRMGVIDLPSFYTTFDLSNTREKTEQKSTTADVVRLLNKFKEQNVGGVILDLRRNGGGSLEEAIRLTGLFIKDGPVVQVKDYDNSVQEDDDPDPSVAYDGPLIVLTSRLSASASEILAGALQDYGRALIVGDSSTHGKGTVQSVQPLHIRGSSLVTNENPGALKLTIKKFYRPSGASTQLKGVVPDIVLPSLFNEAKEIGESALDNPLKWDTIEKAKGYEHLEMVDPYLRELRKRSTERVASDKEFSYIREDIELYKKRMADKYYSLNQKQELAEKQEADARQKARDKERLARKDLPEKVYEISLKQAALPGLPPPVAKTNAALAKLAGSATGAGVSTNGALAAVKSPMPVDDLDETPDEEKVPAVDADMIESEHILMDYISLLPKSNVASAIH